MRLTQEPLPEIKGAVNLQMYDSNGLKILNLDLRGLEQDRESKGGAPFFSVGSEMWKAVRPGWWLNLAHLECCPDVRLFVVCFIWAWPANSPFLFVCMMFCTVLLINV